MNFDYGNTLISALKLTWKHKILWVLLMLPMVMSFLAFSPFFFSPLLFSDGEISEAVGMIAGILGILFFLIFFIATMVFHVVATSSATLGIIRVERGEGSINFMDLLRDSFPYFWRSLGAFLIVQLVAGVIFTGFFLFVFFLSIVTLGMASVCLQPLMILLTPFTFLVIAVIESAQTAIIIDNLGAVDAIKRGIQVVREHVWKYVIITLIIYFGTMILTSFIIFPVMLPIFFMPVLIESGVDINNQMMAVFFVGGMCLFMPVMVFVSGITQTFMKASLDITYLRLTRPGENQAVYLEENPQVDGTN